MTKLENDINECKVKRVIVAGDSWTYGSEIRDPDLPESVNDWDAPNDAYRLPRIWPNKLGNLLGTTDVVNLSYPAASNDQIVRNLVGWLTEHYLSPGKSTEELLVVVGFTSPERKDFYYKNPEENNSWWFTMWPMWGHKYLQPPIEKFAKLYIEYFYNAEEYTHRYLHQIFYLQNLFKTYNIKFVFFQAFYQRADLHIKQWRDEPYTRHYRGQPDSLVWDMIDPVCFMHKNDEIQSFHNYIKAKDPDPYARVSISGMHPSELGHTWWAEHVYEYIKENKIC
jgi:hypothetical protein